MTSLTAALLLSLGQAFTDEEFQRLHARLAPSRGEAWRSIPWTTSLSEAREKAAREKKPLFLWAMNGSPLGCT
jgi:hypothetical protein